VSTVNIDLADPVLTVISFLDEEFSEVPVTVISDNGTNYQRGGYSGEKPRIIPVEGPIVDGKWRPRRGRTALKTIPAKCEIYVYEVADGGDAEQDIQEDFGDVIIQVSIDIYHGQNKARLVELYNEIRRCIYKRKLSPGGNYHYLKRVGKQDLTNRATSLFRYVLDIELVKVSDFLGHT